MDPATEAEWYWAGKPATPDDEIAWTRVAAAIYCHDDLRALSGLSLFQMMELKARRMKRCKWRQKRRRRATMKFEEAISGLPTTTPKEEIVDWIAAHPAMSRHIWMEEEDGPIILTAQDVMEAPHGVAPCRAAATQLQSFVNRPDKFYDKMLDRQVSFPPEYSDYH